MKKKVNLTFFAIIGSVFIVSYIPIINIPFTWIMTFFHEISHAIATLLTAGSIIKIKLHLSGSGLCYSSGGIRFIILQAGYIGAVLWGILIYEMADNKNDKLTNVITICFLALILLSAIFYARDFLTWIILSIIFGMFFIINRQKHNSLQKLSLKFIGIYVLLDAVKAPLHLIDGRHYGDGASLSDLTKIPEIFWVLIWLAIGIAGLIYIWKTNKKQIPS